MRIRYSIYQMKKNLDAINTYLRLKMNSKLPAEQLINRFLQAYKHEQ